MASLLIKTSPILAIYNFLTPMPTKQEPKARESKADRVLGRAKGQDSGVPEVSAILQIGIGFLVLVAARVLWLNVVLVPNGWVGKCVRFRHGTVKGLQR